MNGLTIFNSNEFGEIRTVTIDGEPWFVGKDIADALGYKNTKDAISSHVDSDDKKIIQRSDIATLENNLPKSAFPFNFTSAEIPNRGLAVINESGLYALIFGSKLESAQRFKHWVTSEVLPVIRKTGSYQMQAPQGKELLALAVLEAQKTIEAQTAEIERMKPKEIFADAVAASHTSILIGDLAKLLRQNGVETGQRRLFDWLRENGYLIKRKGSDWNMPTQRSMELGLFEVKESTVNNPDGSVRTNRTTKVTGKGQQYFINKFIGKSTHVALG